MKNYLEPEIKLVRFTMCDIVTDSPPIGEGGDDDPDSIGGGKGDF